MPADRQEVLKSLPRSRPVRRSAKRGGAAEGDGGARETDQRAAKAAARPKAKPAAKPKAAARAKPKTKTKAAGGGTKRKAAAKPSAASKAARPAAKPRAATRPKAAPGRPEPVSTASPDLADFPTEPPSGPVDPPSRQELLESAAKAAGEIAQAGLTVYREALKSVVRRLPRP